MQELTFPNLMAALNEYGAAVQKVYRDKLVYKDRVASGNLLQSVSYRVDQGGTIYEVTLSLASYWKYLETGVAPGGRMPPPSKILEWIIVKPVLPRPDDKGRIPTPAQLSWAIAKSIQKKGIKGEPLLADTLDEVNAQYRARIAAAFRLDAAGILQISALQTAVYSRLP